MNKLLCCLLVVGLSLTSYPSIAATTMGNKDDGSAIGTSDTPQIKNQDQTTDSTMTDKPMTKKHKMHKNKSKMNNMDKSTGETITREKKLNYEDPNSKK
ncbi:MAG: hypothetical protein H7Z18_11410 [Methylophilaceae bacterium]|nr:hypothetical protein [Methylophilaceae bacterium]